MRIKGKYETGSHAESYQPKIKQEHHTMEFAKFIEIKCTLVAVHAKN